MFRGVSIADRHFEQAKATECCERSTFGQSSISINYSNRRRATFDPNRKRFAAKASIELSCSVAVNVGDQVAETVHIDYFAAKLARRLNRSRQLQLPDRSERRPERRDRRPARKMRGGRRKDVAAMEGGTHVGKTMAGRSQFHDSLDPRRGCGEPKNAVVGSDKASAGASVDRYRRALSADTGIDHRKENRERREITPTLAQNDRASDDRLGRDAVGDVYNRSRGGDRCDHALHRADIMVAIAEVGYDCERGTASRERRHRGSKPRIACLAQFVELKLTRRDR